jgi:HPt (histidine-containing phosphotransfer) domain-containing protein
MRHADFKTVQHVDNCNIWVIQEEQNDQSKESLKEDSMTINIPGIDFEKGLEVFDGEIDDYLAALNSFITSVPQIIVKLRGVTENNLQDYAINAHGLKSTSGWICAEKIQKEAMELEAFAKAGNLSDVLSRNDKFIDDVLTFVNDLEAELQKN